MPAKGQVKETPVEVKGRKSGSKAVDTEHVTRKRMQTEEETQLKSLITEATAEVCVSRLYVCHIYVRVTFMCVSRSCVRHIHVSLTFVRASHLCVCHVHVCVIFKCLSRVSV